MCSKHFAVEATETARANAYLHGVGEKRRLCIGDLQLHMEATGHGTREGAYLSVVGRKGDCGFVIGNCAYEKKHHRQIAMYGGMHKISSFMLRFFG